MLTVLLGADLAFIEPLYIPSIRPAFTEDTLDRRVILAYSGERKLRVTGKESYIHGQELPFSYASLSPMATLSF